MALHVRSCRACSAQKAAEESFRPCLTAQAARSEQTPEEAAAVERVTQRWLEAFAQPLEPATHGPVSYRRARWSPGRRLVTATAVLGAALALFAGSALYAPRKAMAEVADAMKRVQRFHLRMELPGIETHFEAWGERRVGARAEEWEGSRLRTVILDDGKKLRGFYLEERVVREGKTHLKEFFREAAGFNASKMLSQAATGKLFEKAEWLGEPTAREVARVQRNGIPQRRIEVDLKGGFFERMVIYADRQTDRLTQANLYTDRRNPDEEPFARVYFEYPEQIDPMLFKNLPPPPGPTLKFREEDLQP